MRDVRAVPISGDVTALRDDVLALPPRHSTIGGSRDTATIYEAIYAEAEQFIRMFHRARPKAGQLEARLAKVRAEVAATGTYRHTSAELAFGARLALRESGWCPANVPWRGLLVRDLREVRDGASVAAECAQHLRMAARAGAISPMVTVFAPDTPWRPGPRIRNDQLVPVRGSTILCAGDEILALTDPERGPDLTPIFTARPGTGHADPAPA